MRIHGHCVNRGNSAQNTMAAAATEAIFCIRLKTMTTVGSRARISSGSTANNDAMAAGTGPSTNPAARSTGRSRSTAKRSFGRTGRRSTAKTNSPHGRSPAQDHAGTSMPTASVSNATTSTATPAVSRPNRG